jgi:hypothetical protein
MRRADVTHLLAWAVGRVIGIDATQVRVIPCFGTALPLGGEFCRNIGAIVAVTLNFTLREGTHL